MKHEAMTDRDYQRLAALLTPFQDQGCMNLETLDGFFTALICGPVPVSPGECLPIILGQAFDDEAAFPGTLALERFASLLFRHWMDIRTTLEQEQSFHPWLEADEHGHFQGKDWACGFVKGMELQYDDWTLLLDDPEQGAVLAPIMALALEDQADADMQAWLEAFGADQHSALLAGISPAVGETWAFFAAVRNHLQDDDVIL